jgi:two-component system, chemotaxis family, sensor kinase CheA
VTGPTDHLRQLLAGEIARHLPRLQVESPNPTDVRAVLHALKGSAAMAQEQDLALVIGQLSAAIRHGEVALIPDVAGLLRDALTRLEAGLAPLATAWPEPPPLLGPAQVNPRFRTEYQAAMRDRLAELDGALTGEERPDAVESAYRTVHAMKGAASSVGDDVTAWYCHGLESQLKEASAQGASHVLHELGRHRAVIALLLEQPADALVTLHSLGGLQTAQRRPTRASELPPTEGENTGDSDALLRIPASVADRLLEQLEATFHVKDELKSAAVASRELAVSLRGQRSLLLEALHSAGASDSLATPVEVAARRLEQSAEALDVVTRICRRNAETLQLRTVEMRQEVATLRRTTLRWLFDRVAFAVERLVDSGGHATHVEAVGGDLPVDRRVAERLLEPVMQLVRNAVAHGIEPADRRAAAGKPAVGTIWLHAQRLGDWLRLVVEDDGVGVDVERIRQLAVERGAVAADAADGAHEDELLAMLFLPGVTTQERPDLLAGRGVGLELAQTLVRRLGGGIRLARRAEGGFSATIEVPSESGLVDVLWLTCAGYEFALPVGFTGSIVPMAQAPETVSLAACLDLPVGRRPGLSLELGLHGVQPIRIGVDDVGRVEETSIRALPPLVAAAGPYAGAILRSDGSLRLALDAALLAARAWAHAG